MTKRPATIFGCSTDQKEECDYKYLARVYFYRTIISVILGCVSVSAGVIWYTASWKAEQEFKVADLNKRVSSVEKVQNDLDTIKVLLRKMGE